MTESLTLAMSYADESGELKDIEQVLVLVQGYRQMHPQMYNTLNQIEHDYSKRKRKLMPKTREVKQPKKKIIKNDNRWKPGDDQW